MYGPVAMERDFKLLYLVYLPLSVFSFALCLKVTHVSVPSEVMQGHDVNLDCYFDLEGQSLYSLKWYKGQHEFFRYVPKQLPHIRFFPWSSFQINASESSINDIGRVRLINVTSEAEGIYKCEISTEAPIFYTDHKEANLTVLQVYSDGPVLRAAGQASTSSPSWNPGEGVPVQCAMNRTKPAAKLQLFIGDASASELKVDGPLPSCDSDDICDVQISFQLSWDDVKSDSIVVKCVAHLGSLFSSTTSMELNRVWQLPHSNDTKLKAPLGEDSSQFAPHSQSVLAAAAQPGILGTPKTSLSIILMNVALHHKLFLQLLLIDL